MNCVETIYLCQSAIATFSCRIEGQIMEWGNTTRAENRIRFRAEDPAGTIIHVGTATAIITSRDTTGVSSEYTLSISAGVQYGRTVVYCRDRSDNSVRGDDNVCPPTTITPGIYAIEVHYNCISKKILYHAYVYKYNLVNVYLTFQ